MSITLKICNDQKEWDVLVDGCPHGTLFHTWNWLKIVERYTSTKLYPIIGLKGTTPIGVLPLFFQRKKLVNLGFSPPPRVGLLYLGPLILDYDQLKQSKKESTFIGFQKEIDDFIFSRINANYLRVRSSPGLLDSRPFKWTGYDVEPFYTYMIDLSKGEDYVWSQFNKQLRMDINKTEREGVSVEEGSKEGLKFLHSSIIKRFEEQGLTSSISRDYLFELYDSFHPQNMRVFIAKYRGETVGGQIALCYKGKVSLWVGVPKTTLRGIYPNDLVQWEVIKWACKNDYKRYEIMDSGHNPRLRHFKSKYNPDLSMWFSAVKYSSAFFEVSEKLVKCTQKFKSRCLN